MNPNVLELVTGDTRQRRSNGASRANGIEALIERHTDAYWYYGSGKVALRDGLRTMLQVEGYPGEGDARSDGDVGGSEYGSGSPTPRSKPNVLLPAYIPNAVAEPLRELGLDPRYYAISPDLRPEEPDLRRRMDRRTVAVTSVNYFGFPQPGIGTVASLADEFGCYHVDDNAHATLSVADGQLLGTLGDVGISSLWKTLPIPNGAVLYVTNDALRERFDPSSLAGVSDRVTAADARYLCATRVRAVLENRPRLRRPVEALVDRLPGTTVPSPERRYDAAKRRFSALSARVCAGTDPTALRRRRRQNYRAWLDALETVPRVTPLFPDLADGICPQAMPVETDRPRRVQSRLAAEGLDGVHTWPRLADAVAADPTYATAQSLAEHVLALPVGRRVDPERIVTIGAGLAAD